jgi:hypothetical protein
MGCCGSQADEVRLLSVSMTRARGQLLGFMTLCFANYLNFLGQESLFSYQ